MGLGIPPLQIKITLESNPRTSTMFIGRLGVTDSDNGTGNLVNTHSNLLNCCVTHIFVILSSICEPKTIQTTNKHKQVFIKHCCLNVRAYITHFNDSGWPQERADFATSIICIICIICIMCIICIICLYVLYVLHVLHVLYVLYEL